MNRRAWLVWGVGLSVYLLAIFNRSSLGVAGLIAADRFDIKATQLSLFTVFQLILYAGRQIPVGVLIDRFGPKKVLVGGVLLMTLGQIGFAFAESLWTGLLARSVIGAGDAAVFTSLLRLIYAWFPVRRAGVLGQFTGYCGQLGAVAASFPLTLLLHELGWTKAFAVVAVIGVVFLVAVVAVVSDSPDRHVRTAEVKISRLVREIGAVWSNPGTQLAVWTHFVTAFSITMFALLWGFPFLVRGEGLTSAQANTILSIVALSNIAGGLLITRLTLRWRFYRSLVALAVVAVCVVSWTVVLAWPGRAPFGVLIVTFALISVGGPASMIGFDLGRTFNPDRTTGRANGVVNIGNFSGAVVTAAAIGVILDLRRDGGMAAYTLTDFKVAMSSQYALWALGTVQVLRYRKKAIALLESDHPGAVDALRRGDHYVPE